MFRADSARWIPGTSVDSFVIVAYYPTVNSIKSCSRKINDQEHDTYVSQAVNTAFSKSIIEKMREEGIEPPAAGSGIQRSTTELFPQYI